MIFNFKKITNKILFFFYFVNNITNTIYCKNKCCSGKKNNSYSGRKQSEQENLDTQDSSTIEQKEKDKGKEEENKIKEEKEKLQNLENLKLDFINKFNKINSDIDKLINHKNNKFKIKKEEILMIKLNEITELKFEEIENFKQNFEISENNFKNLIKKLADNLKENFQNLKKIKTNDITLDVVEDDFKNLVESSKIIEIDNKLINFEIIINNGKDDFLKEIELLYNEILSKKDKIKIFIDIDIDKKFDFNKDTFDLIKTKGIKELLEIKTKLDNLKSEYNKNLIEKTNNSRAKYNNLIKILKDCEENGIDLDLKIDEKNFNFNDYENNFDEIDENIEYYENILNEKFDNEFINLNDERENINKKLVGFKLPTIDDEFEYNEDENLNKKLLMIIQFNKTLNCKEKLINNNIKDKKEICNNKLKDLKKNEDSYSIDNDILYNFKDEFKSIENDINSLESENKYNEIINKIINLKDEITKKVEAEEERNKYKEEFEKLTENDELLYEEYVKIFEIFKKIYDKLDKEDNKNTNFLKDLIDNKKIKLKKNDTNSFYKTFIGKGCFGKVYQINDNLVMKEIIPNEKFKKKPGYYIKFTNKEIKFLILFKNYPNILQINNVFYEYIYNNYYELPIIITEYYKKGCLTDNLKNLDNEDIIKIMYELIISLKNIHKNGVIHRDIKLDNIFLDKDNKAYIGDFGLAKIGDYEQVGTGTQAYFPPHTDNKRCSRKKLDLYALLLCFISMIEKNEVAIKDDNLHIRIDNNNYEEYKSFTKIEEFDKNCLSGINDIFKKVFLNNKYNEILTWNNFLKTDFWKNLKAKYEKIKNKK